MAGLLRLAESFAGDEEPLLDAIIELAGEHEDEVQEERLVRFGETIKAPLPAEALTPLRPRHHKWGVGYAQFSPE